VHGPTSFPLPTRKLELLLASESSASSKERISPSIIVTPTFGKHRPDADAIFAYAEGYQVAYYIMFLETLTATGYMGDLVLAIAHDSYLHDGVKEYLKQYTLAEDESAQDAQRHHSKPNVVVYQLDLSCDDTDDGKRAVMDLSKNTDVFQMCRLDDVYGYVDAMTNTTIPRKDAREGRVVATLRYEWYWIWSRQYHSHSWLMLLDARDSFFQSNPSRNVQ
jgi:hypothetical protein